VPPIKKKPTLSRIDLALLIVACACDLNKKG